MVRKALIMAAIAIALTMGAPARAELWCGNGRGTPLDHPCTEQDTEQDPAVAATVDKYSEQWRAVHGVWQVSAGTNQTGTTMEIRVYVEPQQLAAAKDRIPSEVDGIPVAFVPKTIPRGTGGSFIQLSKTNTYDPEAAERQEKEQVLRAAFSDAMQSYGRTWNDLPGVIDVGPGKCKGAECDFTSIKIVVQAQFLDEVKAQIPDAVNGIPVVFIPYNGVDQ